MIHWWWLPIAMCGSGILCFFAAAAFRVAKAADEGMTATDAEHADG